MSDNNTELVLLGAKFAGSNWLLPVISCVLERCIFEPVKLFALDVELLNVPGKTNSDKLISIKKIFYHIDGFGGALTPSKFPGIIRSTFTSESSLNKAKLMVINKKVVVNTNLKKVNSCTNQKIIIKEIPVDLPRSAIKAVFSKFDKIVSVKLQLNMNYLRWLIWSQLDGLCLWKKILFVWQRQLHQTLLYTLLIGTTAHDLSGLLDSYSGKTCVIGYNPVMYVYNRCAVICFVDEAFKVAVIGSAPIFKGVSLHWAGFSLVCCTACKQFSHVSGACSVGENSGGCGKHVVTSQNWICLANIYRKKHTYICRSVSFSVASSVGLILGVKPLSMASESLDISDLSNYLASLECSLELLANRVSSIVKKLSCVELVPLMPLSCVSFLAVFAPAGSIKDSDMALDDGSTLFVPSFSSANESVVVFSSSSSKVFIFKVGGLESKMSALETSISLVLLSFVSMSDLVWKFATCNVRGINVLTKQADIVCWHVSSGNMVFFVTKTKLRSSAGPWIKNKFDGVQIFTSGLDVGHLGAGVAVIMNNFLAHHVSKIDEISGQVVSVQLLFKDKLSVTVLGLYAGASSGVRFNKTFKVNSIIAKAVNTSTFVILGENFNESSAVMVLLVGDLFFDAQAGGDLDTMWTILERELVAFFKVLWVELFIAKIVSKICSGNMLGVNCFVRKWSTLNRAKACIFSNLIILGENSVVLLKHLSLVHKEYRRSKMFESRLAEETFIWNAIDKCMKSFVSNKDGIIRSVLDQFFYKVVLDHLVVDGDLVLEPKEVKSKIDEIIIGWTRVCTVPLLLPDHWVHQYMPLDYVRDKAFSGVMKEIGMKELLLVVGGLPDGKATGGFKLSVDFVEWLLAWVSIISKPYDWDDVLTNMHPIALIKTARKILSKVLCNQISFACSKFDVLHGDNFSVLKGMSIQSLVFAVRAVVENALEKNRELWLVLQNMQKAYNFVGWHHLRANLQKIKMCDKFIEFFGNIHKNRFNKVMTNFGLSDGYHVCDDLNQGQIESSSELSSYFMAGAFINDGNCQAATQNILDIANKFFVVNKIFINNEKTVAIPINLGIKVASLNISGLPILIAKKSEAHHYLGIFLSTEELSKLSVTKAHSDVHFFANVVFKKAITNKQFLYLVSAVLQPIDVILRKGLKFKTGLSCDFPSEALCYPSLYGLKFFEQMQSEGKLAALISFSNSSRVLGQLFEHRCLNLQVLVWSPLNPLQFPVKLHVSPVNNFLAGVIKILLCNKLSLLNSLPNTFCSPGSFSVSSILGSSLHFNSVHSLMHFGVAFGNRLFDRKRCQKLDPRGSVSYWFRVVSDFLCRAGVLLAGSIFTDGSLKNFGHADVASGVAAYFSAIDLSIGVRVHGLLSSTMAKLQAIALFLKCVLSSCTVVVHTNSQMAINTCISEMSLSAPNFCSSCWLEKRQIFNLIHKKNFFVWWVKVKEHSGIFGNVKADAAVDDAAFFYLSLPVNLYRSVCCAQWEAGLGCNVISEMLIKTVDWGATAKKSSCLCTYLMKAVHRQLSVAVRKRLYDRFYSGVLCLLCHEICGEVLAVASVDWLSMVGSCGSLPSACAEAVGIFDDRKEAIGAVVGFVGI
ncbi:hypothetical protein G9A89_017849 [Geosiphon pyriformis]|nr:hypothetical protein G9A89_017849 [Geosiphon pyriformis]